LLKAIKHPTVTTIQYLHDENDTCSVFYTIKSTEMIDQKSNDLRIKIDNLDPSNYKDIVSLCQNASFNITFIAVLREVSLKELHGGQINVSINNLEKDEIT
jgi:hypothetical protein